MACSVNWAEIRICGSWPGRKQVIPSTSSPSSERSAYWSRLLLCCSTRTVRSSVESGKRTSP